MARQTLFSADAARDDTAGSLTNLEPMEELLEATTDCAFILDENWRFTYLNNRATAELGMENLRGTNVWQSFPQAVGTIFEDVYRRVAAQKKSETFEAPYPPLEAWYEVHAVPFRGGIVVFFRNITSRRAASEALTRRYNELDTVLSRAGVGIMQYVEGHRLTLVNEMFCKILGRSKAELDGLPMEAFTHPEDIPKNQELLKVHRRTGTPFEIKKRYLRPNGETVWCCVTVSFVQLQEDLLGTIVVARDITHEVEADQREREVRTLLQNVVDSADDLIFVKDVDGRFVLVNRRMREDHRAKAGKLGGDTYPELAHSFSAEDRRVIETGQHLVVDQQIQVGDETRTFQTIKVPWKQNGTIKGVIGIARDITDRVRSEQAMRDSEERYRLAAMATRDVIWDWDLERGTAEWTTAASSLTGVQPGKTLEWWLDRIHPEDRDGVMTSVEAYIAAGPPRWEYEYRFRRPDGSYAWVHDRGFLQRDENGNPVRMIGAMSDISDRVQAQVRMKKLQAELIHVSRVSAMGTMGSALAHEINQPLAAAGNYVQGARRLLATDPSSGLLHSGLEQAHMQIARAGEIVRRLRHMVERGSADAHPVMLLKAVREAAALAVPESEATGAKVSVKVSPATRVIADAIQLQQVLFNILRNSAEAVAHTAAKQIVVTANQQQDEVLIRVSDTGEGLHEDIKERLFSTFASTKAGGLGVGLSICRTIVEAHGGKIWAEDAEGGGTVIALTLPAAGRREDVTPEEEG